MSQESGKATLIEFVHSSEAFFDEVLLQAMEKRRFNANEVIRRYLVGLMTSYIVTEKLTLEATLAETLLRAQQAERAMRIEMLRRLGDTSLYVSGFFGDSLRRKIVDVDYYAEIGGVAYGALASEVEAGDQAHVFKDISSKFLDYVDLLTYVSQNAMIQSNQDLLRLYERYISTGSDLAKEQLLEKGLLANSDLKKASNQ